MVHVVQTEITDEQLAAEAAREGSDGPAFTELVERHRLRVWRVCYRLMGNEEDANDAAQEVLVRLFLQRARFEGRSKYATWMQSIAVNTCLALRRRRGRRERRETMAAQYELQRHGHQSQHDAAQTLDLMQMLETLDEEDRAMVIMKYAEDYSYEELSSIFDRSVSACKMRISRAREQLRQHFPSEMGAPT